LGALRGEPPLEGVGRDFGSAAGEGFPHDKSSQHLAALPTIQFVAASSPVVSRVCLAFETKAWELKTRKVQELGEFVIATGADPLAPEELAGALIMLAETTDPGKKEAWVKRGAAMFRQRSRPFGPATDRDINRAPAQPGRVQPPSGSNGPT
jgi:DNA-binding protein H-NS